MARWGDENTVRFIRLYKEHECLWNSNSPLYKNKIARDNAYVSIQEEMNEYIMTIKEIKNKIKGLRSTYHQELNKIKHSKSAAASPSDIYKPTLSWFKEMDFLNDIFEYRKSKSEFQFCSASVGQPASPEEVLVKDEVQQLSPQTSEDAHEPLQPSEASTDAIQQSQPFQTSTEVFEQSRTLNSVPIYMKKRPQVVRKAIFHNRKRQEPYNRTLSALQRLEKVSSEMSTNTRSNDDEFFFFGQSVAAQLRSMSLENALDMQAKIQMLLSSERSRLLHQPSTSFSQHFPPYT